MKRRTSIFKTLNESVVNTVILCLCLLAAVSQNGKIFGIPYENLFSGEEKLIEINPPVHNIISEAGIDNAVFDKISRGVWAIYSDDNHSKAFVLSSIPFTKGLYGFAGPVPMYIFLNQDSTISHVHMSENDETPEFVRAVHQEGIISQWYNLPSHQIDDFKPDAISGASITCFAINKGIQRSVRSFAKISTIEKTNHFNVKSILALFVLLSGLIISFWKAPNRHLRNIQLLLNLVVLGFYCGQFISMKSLLAFVQNGLNVMQSIVFISMLLLALLVPLFFKKNAYYCTWICPYGAAQELMGKLSKKKVRFKPKLRKYLGNLRSLLTMSLLFSLWLGVSFDMINYEPFSAFLFEHASLAIILIAVIGLILSIFLPMPFCRYACPTGELLKWTQKMK